MRVKVVKISGYVLLSLFIVSSLTGCFFIRRFENNFFKEKPTLLESTLTSESISFSWAKDSLGNYYETKAGIVIPMNIEGFNFQFYMQFDTGVPFSYIYEKDLNSLQKMGLATELIEIDETKYVKQLNLNLDSNHVELKMIKVLKSFGHTFSEADTAGRFVLGTIGSDFIVDRIISIDFKNQQISIFKERPDWMTNLNNFSAFSFKGRRIMLPATLKDKDHNFFYDTGCSPFGLITTKNRFKKYTEEKIPPVVFDANSWGSALPMISKSSDEPLLIGNSMLKLNRVSYLNKYAIVQPLVMPFTSIDGWLGNQAFVESTLILDTKSEEFIVLTK